MLDTNVLIRHFTGDPPELARRATAALASGERLVLTSVVAAECVSVLASVYDVDRHGVVTLLRAVIGFPAIDVPERAVLLRALEIYELERLDFANAHLAASAELAGVRNVLSFDRDLDRVQTIACREP